MEGSRRRNSSSPSMLADLTATHGCDNELSPSNSDLTSNSSLTVNNCKGRLHQIEDSAKDCVTTWTDEKHDLYLDHLESSFVEQLHRSIGVLAFCSNDDSKSHYLSRKLVAKNRNTSAKLKIIQDSYSDKTTLKRKSHHTLTEFSDQNFSAEASEQTCRKKQSKTIYSQV
ncbi:hypothetical protein Lser_V15G45814 [Lactuca serriola]